MSAITFSVDFSGTPDEMDRAAAQYIVDEENARRAAQVPPETPLPDGTGAELKASYLQMLEQIITNAHASYLKQFRTKEIRDVKVRWDLATDAERAAALAELPPAP